MHTIRNTIIIILTSTLSSCHIYRAYQRPESVTVSDSLTVSLSLQQILHRWHPSRGRSFLQIRYFNSLSKRGLPIIPT